MKKINLVICLTYLLGLGNLHAETKVGLLLGLSGVSADAGVECMRGVELARSLDVVKNLESSGDLKFILEDNRSEPKIAVDGFRKLVDIDKVQIVQTARSPIGMAINPISKLRKIPVLGTIGHKDFAVQNEYAYQIWPMTTYEGAFLADNILKEGHKRLVILYTEDEWTKTLAEGLRDKYKELGGDILLYESILPMEANVLSTLTKIKRLKTDAIVYNHTLGELSLVLRKAKELSIGGQIYSNYWAGFKSVIDSVGVSKMEGVKFVEMDLRLPNFQASFSARNEGLVPSAITYACYLSTLASGQAVRNCKESFKDECLRDLKDIPTSDGPVELIDRRVKVGLAIKEVRDGKIVVR